MVHKNKLFLHSGYQLKTAAVGEGDAFLAALIKGMKSGFDDHELLVNANAAGAYVASQNGAVPDLVMRKVKRKF